MAICKHASGHNLRYSAALDYLTKMHDESTNQPVLDDAGKMIERPVYQIAGINCTPYSWTRNCWRDARKYGKNRLKNEVKTHQYIISFAPEDRDKGLTLEECMEEGRAIAEKYFAGHRVLLCAHPDGDNGSGNMHVHIVVCSIRCEAREPDPTWMRLRADGTVKPSEYKAGCKHQDTAVLRHRMDDDLRDFCKVRGYAYFPEGHRAPRKRSAKEEKVRQNGQRRLDRENAARELSGLPMQQAEFHTQQDELRHAIEAAAGKSTSLTELRGHLQNDFYRTAEIIAADGKRRKEQQRINFDVKISRGRISYKHPDAKGWVRGKTLGALYEEKEIQKMLAMNKKRQREQLER